MACPCSPRTRALLARQGGESGVRDLAVLASRFFTFRHAKSAFLAAWMHLKKNHMSKQLKNYVISSRSKSTTTREYFLLGPRRPKDSGGGAASGGPPSVLPPRFRPKRTGSSGSAVGAGAVSWLSSVRRTAIAILRRCLHRANAAAARLADMIAFWIAEKPPVDGAFVSRLLGEALAGG